MRKLYIYPLAVITMLTITSTACLAGSISIDLGLDGASISYDTDSYSEPIYVYKEVNHYRQGPPRYGHYKEKRGTPPHRRHHNKHRAPKRHDNHRPPHGHHRR